MRLVDKLSCMVGNHKYTMMTTSVTQVDGDICRVECTCVHCGKHNCFLTTFTALEKTAEKCHEQMERG